MTEICGPQWVNALCKMVRLTRQFSTLFGIICRGQVCRLTRFHPVNGDKKFPLISAYVEVAEHRASSRISQQHEYETVRCA